MRMVRLPLDYFIIFAQLQHNLTQNKTWSND